MLIDTFRRGALLALIAAVAIVTGKKKPKKQEDTADE